MASDLPIQITLDPGPATTGAKAVTLSVKEIEKAAKEAKKSFADLEKATKEAANAQSSLAKTMVGLPPPPPIVATGLTRIAEKAKELGFNARAAKEKLNEIGKQFSFGLLQQGIVKANAALEEFGLTLGTTGAAVGFQLAGPLGAVAGAAGEIVGTKLGFWFSESDRAASAAAQSYITAAMQMDAFAAGVESAEKAFYKQKKAADDANAAIGGVTRVLAVSTDAYTKARDSVISYSIALTQLQAGKARQIAGGGTPFTSVDDVNAQRGLRDAQLQLSASTATYGKVLVDIREKEYARRDAIADAKAALAAGAIGQHEYNEYLKQFTTQADAATKALRELIAEEKKLRNSTRVFQVASVVEGFTPTKPQASNADGFQGLIDGAAQTNYDPFAAEDRQRSLDKSNKEALEFKATVDQLAHDSLASLQTMAHSVGDSLVDAFTKGEFSASQFFSSLASMALKGLTNNLINFGFSQFNGASTGVDYMANTSRLQVPGFATGGDVYTRGAGSTDSMLAMIRMTPGESLHVRTPEQRAMSARGTSRKITVDMPNGSQIRYVTEDDFEELHLRSTQRNPAAIRSSLTGR